MTNEKMRKEYFIWLTNIIDSDELRNYGQVINKLYSRDFIWILDRDSSRADDGRELRYAFARDFGCSYKEIELYLDFPCTMLEMMIALADRCENEIMSDADYGNRTGFWFYNMLENSGLSEYNDACYDEDEADDIITRVLDRTYNRDGSGGLFKLKKTRKDLRKEEIWYQMCWYLDEILY